MNTLSTMKKLKKESQFKIQLINKLKLMKK